jgi:hypothetical protein
MFGLVKKAIRVCSENSAGIDDLLEKLALTGSDLRSSGKHWQHERHEFSQVLKKRQKKNDVSVTLKSFDLNGILITSFAIPHELFPQRRRHSKCP